jgi:glycerophosphoryl diester phosphodiesterase
VATGNQGRIFISYRRQETAWPARQLYEVLVDRFGAESVFKDVDDIEPGDDFVERITEAVASCDVLLALIGNQWLAMTDIHGGRRLDNPEDFVRLELTAALSRGVRVVPILVDGAVMPRPEQLPPDLVPLTRRQAVEISAVGFNTDRLLVTLAATLESRQPGPVAPEEPAEPAPVEPAPAEDEAPVEDAAPVAEEQPVQEDAPAPKEVSAPQEVSAPPEVSVPVEVSAPTSYEPPVSVPPVPLAAPPTPSMSGTPAATTAPDTARSGRRWLVPVAASAALVVLGGALLVLRPWAGTTQSGADRPTVPSAAPTVASGPTVASSPTVSTSPPVVPGAPLILAHRGGLEVHQFETEQAMEAAAAAGFSIETDVRYTSDGVAVLVHDEQATKGLDCGGRSIRVSGTTWADLNRFCRSKPTAKDPAQYRVPRLDATLEGIAAASDQVMVFIEVKTDLSSQRRKDFLAAPATFGLRDRTVITSFNLDWLRQIRTVDPTTKRMLFVSGKPVPADSLKDEGLYAVAVDQGVASKQYIDDLKEIGVKVMVWTVNDPQQWATLVAFSPDILMTDYPERFKEWLSTR